MNVLDLFSGIGGFSIGLEKAGFKTVAFCEIEPFPRSVLKKHWPTIPVYEDVKTLSAERLRADGITVDVICGGFPCQDISLAGKGAGLSGERSGLWFEFHRLIQEIRPKYVIAENVSALRSRGLDQVLRSLAEIGYDAEWHCIPASAVGAPHQRDRIWIVAYPHNSRLQRLPFTGNFESQRTQSSEQLERLHAGQRKLAVPSRGNRGVHDGVSNRSHRLKALGNAVVPQIPQLIGEAIYAPSH
jgi:DNA (cytosine-5)-methyltransferase 1